MPYSTQANLESKFGEKNILLWSDVDEDGSANADIITTAITDADAEINELLFSVHNVPFTSTPPTINRMSVYLAGFNLYLMRGLRDDSGDEKMKDIRDFALEVLNDIVDGRTILDTSGAEVLRKGINAPVSVDLSGG